MSTGSDGDDDAPIEIELEPTGPTAAAPEPNDDRGGARPAPAAPPPPPLAAAAVAASASPALAAAAVAPAEALEPLPDPAALIARAAEGDLHSDLTLYQAEAAAAPEDGAARDAVRRASLLVEITRLQEDVARDGAAALATARAAFDAAPSQLAAFWSLRRLLAGQRLWEPLAAAYEAALAAAPLEAGYRADLLVERGRLLEDRLGRDQEAAASYREALAAAPDHLPALLSLYLHGVRTADTETAANALAGLAHRAATPERRMAIT